MDIGIGHFLVEHYLVGYQQFAAYQFIVRIEIEVVSQHLLVDIGPFSMKGQSTRNVTEQVAFQAEVIGISCNDIDIPMAHQIYHIGVDAAETQHVGAIDEQHIVALCTLQAGIPTTRQSVM